MKLVKIFAALVVLVLILLFLLQNNAETTVNLIFDGFKNLETEVSMIMLGSLAVGILIGYGVGVTSILSAKADNRSLRTKNRRLSDELNDLRNVAIDEGIYDTEDEDI